MEFREIHPYLGERLVMRRAFLLVLFVLPLTAASLATVFGTVRGIVHDPQHRPVSRIEVVLKAKASEFTLNDSTDDAGQFHFDAVPIGEYAVAISDLNFVADQQSVTVLSGTAPILHFELRLPAQNETVLVSADAAQTETVTPTSLVDRLQIQETPGASRANSLALITDYIPGSYLTHDQLHVRGGHQVSWLIDGVSIPNTNIASNLGPQIDPKDIDTLETQRGSYPADYGDRTYGVFNVSPRTGFERNNEAELVLSAGNSYQTDDQLNIGGHTNRLAYYTSVSGNRTNLGLQTPTSAVLHDAANGYGGFTSLIFNLDPQDQLRLVAQARRDFYQVPTDPNDPAAVLRDVNRESDSFATFSWVRTFSPGLLLTVSPFFHYNSANYRSDPLNIPSAATQDRSSKYEGGQANTSWIKGRNNARAGLYSFAQQDDQFFHVVYNDGSGTVIPPLAQNPTGSLIAAFVEDQFKPASWLTLNAGLRQTHFSGALTENATSPRVGVSVRIPKLNWVFRGFYGHFYQAPPLGALSGPALSAIQSQQQLDFVPLPGERDEEHQFGVTIPIKGWVLDADNFLTRATNFFDHNSLNNSSVFFPVDVQGARINGWEVTLRSPRIRNRAQIYLTYSNQLTLGRGCIVGGLIGACPLPAPGFFTLDHDQRNTLHLGGQYTLPWRAYFSTDVYYASGFSNSNPAIPGDHLQPHTTFDLSLGKSFGERFSVNLQGINVANRRVLLDNSFTFGGTHYLNPREILVQLRYRFHY
jgi:TonB dependent receptor/Carboxypeptidase regulatory-like domain/TonB-dependent Receptor Plug Domain